MISAVVWTCVVFLQGVLCAGSDVVSVSVKEGDSVTLPNDFKITNQDRIKWYYNNTRIAGIDLYNGKSCTDVQCNEGAERFRDRLKLDHQTGNLTIMNITNTHSGKYTLQVISTGGEKEKIFNITVYGVFTDKQEMEKIPVGESDTSDTASVARMCVTAVLLLVIGAAVVV